MSQQVNLFNPLFRPRGFSFTSAQSMLYGVAIAAAGVALSAAYADYELRQVAARAQASNQAHQAATARLAELNTEVAQLKASPQLEAEVAALEAQFKLRQEVADTLRSGAIGNTAGFAGYMRAFSRQTLNGVWLTGFTIDGNDLTLAGRTLNSELVASYLTQLNREEVLRGREFSALRMRQPLPDVDEVPAKGGDARRAAPRHLEFTLSTAPIADEPQRPAVARTPVAPAAVAPVPAIPSAEVEKAVEAVRAGLNPERSR